MLKLLTVLLTLLLITTPIRAEGFRCGNDFVSTGDHKATVLLRCGEPLFAEIISGDDDIKVEEWVYGPQAYKGFLRVLEFRGGRLVDIAVAEKVN